MNRKKAVTTVAKSTNELELALLLNHQNKHVRHAARLKMARLFGLQKIAAQIDECVRRIKEYSNAKAIHTSWAQTPEQRQAMDENNVPKVDTDGKPVMIGRGPEPSVPVKPSDAFWTINALKKADLLDAEYEVAV